MSAGECYQDAVKNYTNMTDKINKVEASLYWTYLIDVINLKN